ncbi:MAG: hypothetical protein GYA17_09580 [Chloroflexi bacterium]|nr:hypothetical protein [Anaerolineaceae bacterium]NMB88599.1 hypothetical protein [Chloroflexota bacterium]
MIDAGQVAALEADLNHFDSQARAAALDRLAAEIYPRPAGSPAFNLHSHTFYSFNAYGHSPSSLAWLARKHGLYMMGIVDFDVLDGVDEFLDACERLSVRGSAGMETRVYIPEFASREINSPGEPGVCYHMAIGFTSSRVPAEVVPVLADLRRRAEHRNRMVMEQVNAYLAPLHIDYEHDVLPLTPAGNATERHMIQAYLSAARRSLADPFAFWAEKLELGAKERQELEPDSPTLQNLIRTRLMKRGGVGYVQPTAETFPALTTVNRLAAACGAVPCFAWLDGASRGEQDIHELLDLMVRQGVAALNIIPDRNWNVDGAQARQEKVRKLYEIVDLAGQLELPLNVGTEMNSFGQKMVDDFEAPELQPVRQAFVDGAQFIYGHTILQRTLGKGSASAWAQEYFPRRGERNRFYTRVGSRFIPGRDGRRRLEALRPDAGPDEILDAL